MTLRLALCFLFHQPLGEHADRANRICYRGVLDVLRNHSGLKFNLMLSGTLLDALCWFDPSFFDAVKSGLRADRFRLLGSTYAQSLLLAGEPRDVASQIAVHRATLKKYFDAEPEAFWSPQRTWSPKLAPLVMESGYRWLALEGDALQAAGAAAPHVHRLAGAEGDLRVVWDDARLRDRMDFAVWFRRRDVVLDALGGWRSRPDAERLFPVLAEDAGAFGLWGYDLGLDPRADAAGLDELLDWIEREEGVECAFVEEAPEPEGPLSIGGAVWSRALDRALADPESPLHEEGYRDWGDFLARAPRLQHFRRMHSAARVRLASSEAKFSAAKGPGSPEENARLPGAELMALAERVYCAHQDRFGSLGVGGRGDPSWEGIGAAIAAAKAAELTASAARPGFESHIDDLTGDGEDEILLRSGERMAILSPYGGRLLHWVDLRRGQLLIGNPLAVPTGSLLIEARPPEFAPLPDDWLPRADDPLPEMQPEGGERRLVRLAGENLPEASGPLPIWPRLRSADLKPSLPARRRALNDYFSLDDGPEEKVDPRLDFRLAEGAVVFLRFFGYRLRMVKRVSLTARGVRAVYRFRNVNMRAVRVRMRLVSEVCPDYSTVLDAPGLCYEPVAVGPRHSPGIKNIRTGNVIVSHVSRPEVEPSGSAPGILAWEMTQTVSFTVDPGRTEAVVVRLNLISGTPPADGSASG
jgi:hypothetical protein